MKIGIDARFWGLEHAGLGRYVMELTKALAKLDRKNQYTIFLRNKYLKQVSFPSNFTLKLADIKHYTFEEQWLLAEIFNKEDLDLLHVPHFNVPLLYKKTFVVTIHDLLWHEVRGLSVTTQNPVVYLTKYAGYKLVVRHALKNAVKIFVPSKTISNKLIQEHGITLDKICLTYEAPSKSFHIKKDKSSILKKYGLKKPYLLYVGSAYPHKNILKAIEATKKVKDSGKEITIAVVSSRSVFLNQVIREIQKKEVQHVVRLIGFVSDDDLAYVYRNAIALIQPSLSEGFGLTGLEAMASGTAVMASDLDIFKEIYGKAAVFFDPRSVDDMARKIKSLLLNHQKRDQLIKISKKRVKSFSWGTLAHKTLAVYSETASITNSK